MRKPKLDVGWAAGILLTAGVSVNPLSVWAEGGPDWARKALDNWYTAHNAGDVAAPTRLYLNEAVLFEPDETLHGRKAIDGRFAREFQAASSLCTWAIDGQLSVGKQAAVWGHDACVETPTSGGAVKTTKSRWLTIFERQADGSWLIARDAGEDIAP